MSSGIGNLDDFLAGLDLDVADVGKTLLAETQAGADTALTVAVEGTPVLTGLHRGSWVVGIGSDPGPSGNQPDAGGQATIQAGQAVVATAQAGQQIIILNDGPAIEELDEGRSNQAPEGFSLAAELAAARSK